MTVVAVLGLGEAGGEIAAGLVAVGATVRGYDPIPERVAPPGAADCAGEAEACAGAGLVLSLNSSHDAETALRNALPGCAPGAVYADLNTAAPALKGRLAELAAAGAATGAGAARGPALADVALMSTVPGKGVRTPMLAAGAGAARFAEMWRPLGGRVDVVAGPAGAAAQRKLLRSIFYKGMGAAVVEALAAARAAGLEDWMRAHLEEELATADAALVGRLERGSVLHAWRRAGEMEAAGAMVADLGVPPHVCRASEAWLRRLAGDDGPHGAGSGNPT